MGEDEKNTIRLSFEQYDLWVLYSNFLFHLISSLLLILESSIQISVVVDRYGRFFYPFPSRVCTKAHLSFDFNGQLVDPDFEPVYTGFMESGD